MAAPSSRTRPAVVASLVAAALAATALALVGFAYLMGWVGMHENAPPTPGSIALRGSQVAGSVPDLGQPPGDDVVAIPQPPKPAVPPPAPKKPERAR